MSDQAVLQLENVERIYGSGETKLAVLNRIDLAVRPGELVGLVGPSGAGKTTLLQISGLLDRADGGRVRIAGEEVSNASDDRMSQLRGRYIGYVFQFHHLLPEFSALENVVLPQLVIGRKKREARARAEKLINAVGLTPRAHHRPGELSGGEQQRVALARALANEPRLLLADEPTGNLDHATGNKIAAVLRDLVRDSGLGALIATHNLELAGMMDRVVTLQDGLLTETDQLPVMPHP